MLTPARSGSNASAFARTAAEELVTMRSFVTLLEQERGVLEEGKADALPGLAAEKTTLLEILSRCAEQRAQLLGAPNGSGTVAGVQRLLGSDPDAQQIWSSLIDVARRAAELNAGNGFLVSQQLAHVDRAIDAIGGPRSSLYNTSGITNYGSGASRSLAQG